MTGFNLEMLFKMFKGVSTYGLKLHCVSADESKATTSRVPQKQQSMLCTFVPTLSSIVIVNGKGGRYEYHDE
jgi:hypothetical protein